MPTQGVITSNFGMRVDPISGRMEFHKGIDIKGDEKGLVFAVESGVIKFVGKKNDCGNKIVISHDEDVESNYCHLKKIFIKKGEKVTKGKLIGVVGNSGRTTGPHLHYEVRFKNRPINPQKFF